MMFLLVLGLEKTKIRESGSYVLSKDISNHCPTIHSSKHLLFNPAYLSICVPAFLRGHKLTNAYSSNQSHYQRLYTITSPSTNLRAYPSYNTGSPTVRWQPTRVPANLSILLNPLPPPTTCLATYLPMYQLRTVVNAQPNIHNNSKTKRRGEGGGGLASA